MSGIAYFPPPPTIESLGGATEQDITDHNADSTSVHAITDTAQVALKNAAQTFTEDQSIEAENRINFGDAGAAQGYSSGATGGVLWARNCYWDGSTFRRRVADNDAAAIIMGANGSLIVATQTDGNATADSEITFGTRLNIVGATMGFYGVTPTARPSAYTQTYSTASKTHPALTSPFLTDNSGGTADGTLQSISVTPTQAEVRNNFAEVATACNGLRVDIDNLKKVVNSVIDDLQALGFAQ